MGVPSSEEEAQAPPNASYNPAEPPLAIKMTILVMFNSILNEKMLNFWSEKMHFSAKFVKILENKLSKICKILKIKVARRMQIL